MANKILTSQIGNNLHALIVAENNRDSMALIINPNDFSGTLSVGTEDQRIALIDRNALLSLMVLRYAEIAANDDITDAISPTPAEIENAQNANVDPLLLQNKDLIAEAMQAFEDSGYIRY